VDSASRDQISLVVSKGEVVRVRKIQAAEMAVAAETQITHLDRMRSHVANRRGPHEEAVSIEFNPTSIVVVMKAALDRVALANEILAKDVCDVNVLMARVEPVEATVRVFLEHRKVRAIELVTIVVERAKHT